MFSSDRSGVECDREQRNGSIVLKVFEDCDLITLILVTWANLGLLVSMNIPVEPKARISRTFQ